ncbi:MAG: CocE/NonD family hydrolase [Deltaproteobacteria bacterium]|nr:MAG: CocE/NonD family hydrolase [Deltaproteobacteria bacterium]
MLHCERSCWNGFVVIPLMFFLLAPSCRRERETVMVPMRDGVHLATDIYFPQSPGPHPALLSRTPYGKSRLSTIAKQWIQEGYVVVTQDIRGTNDSEGTFNLFYEDGWGDIEDGYDTITWIEAQPWSNGEVCTFGSSALAITQLGAAGSVPPGMRCMVPVIVPSDGYQDTAFQGGAFRKSLVENWLASLGEEDLIPTVLEHYRLSEWWQERNFLERTDLVESTGFFVSGWFDIFQQGALNAFMGLDTAGGQETRHRIVIGPWTHTGLYQRRQGELTFPPNAVSWTGAENFELAWFDFWLKGIDSGITEEPAVYYYTMGDTDDPRAPGNEWRSADHWPVESVSTPYYLGSEGSLSPTLPETPGELHFTYDPNDPVPTLGGNNLFLERGPYDQRELEARDDVLTFTTPPLSSPLEVTGRVKARLWVASDAPDTDFTVKLTDVYPDGRSILLLDGIFRMRFREGFDQEAFLAPGEIYEIEVDLWSTSIVFNKGHQIRVAISSSNYPRFGINTNTVDPPESGAEPKIANQTIHYGPGHPSQILLPVVRP